MKKNNRKGIWIDKEIMDDPKLDCTNRFILAEIYSLCKLPSGCTAGDKHFADLVGLSDSNINKRINKLKKDGYFNTFIHKKNKKILGRTITLKKSSILKNESVVVTSPEQDLVFQNEDVSIALVKDSVFQNEDGSIAPLNINNSGTNSNLLKHIKDQYTGDDLFKKEIKTGQSSFEVLNSIYEELIFKLVNSSSIGEKILSYVSEEGIQQIKDNQEISDLEVVIPLLKNVLQVEKQLYGNK